MSHFKQSTSELKVNHNFKLYVLILSKKVNWQEEAILENIYKLNGYKCHRTVKYRHFTSHIHVKFGEEHLAKEAVDYINNLNTDLTAGLVDDMLRDWFRFEVKTKYDVPYTLTIVDIIGNPPFAVNFLKKNILESLFQNFGDPYLVPYTAAVTEPHVQVLFSSMADALAACIAFGEWYYRREKMDSFFHRVRINPSDKEVYLIKRSGGKPEEAFKLDYFVNSGNRFVPKSKVRETDVRRSRISKSKVSTQHKEAYKVRQQINVPLLQTVQNNMAGSHTPILCVPVITPLNNLYSEPLAPNSNQLGDVTATVLNVEQKYSHVTLTKASSSESEPEIRENLEPQNSNVCSDRSVPRLNVNQTLETKHPKDIVSQPHDDIILNKIGSKYAHTSSTKHKNAHPGTQRIFRRHR